MLIHPILEQMHSLRLTGMVKAFEEQLQMREVDELSFEERLGLLVDREATDRASRRLETRLRKAKLRQRGCLEDIDFRHPRGLDKRQVLSLSSCEWIRNHHNLLITGKAGVGKTFMACAFAQKACREGLTSLYRRVPRLLGELAVARGDGSLEKLLRTFARTDLLVLDDFGLVPLSPSDRRDLLEILEDREGLRSTLVTSQLPVEHWHDAVGDPTIADAILERLAHPAHRMKLRGESIRRKRAASMDLTSSNEAPRETEADVTG